MLWQKDKHNMLLLIYIFSQHSQTLNPFPNNKILNSSKLKESADDIFKFDENGTKFSEWLENTVGKGEIARYGQFLLFPQCFQKSCNAAT